MESGTSEFVYPVDCQISIDLFGSKKHPGVTRGDLAFANSSGRIVFKVNHQSRRSSLTSNNKKVLLDDSGNPLLSIYQYHNGSWRCYKGDNNEDRDLVFRVQRSQKTLTIVELEVFLAGERLEDSICNLKVRGSPFQRSCKIYKDNAPVAQLWYVRIEKNGETEKTSLMNKLNQIFVSRRKFRLTIFPGTTDHALIVALVVIFLDGRK